MLMWININNIVIIKILLNIKNSIIDNSELLVNSGSFFV